MRMSLTFQPTLTGHSHLRGLIVLRSVTIAGQISALLLALHFMHAGLDWVSMAAAIAALAAINFATWLRLRSHHPVSNAELFIQLCLDVTALSILLYFSGGSTNPFISLFMLQIIIAAATLPPAHTWAMAAFTTASYSLLMKFYIPLPMADGTHEHIHHAMQSDDIFSMHVLGMWLGFVISAAVVALFVVRMAQTVRERDRTIAQVREETLRNERIVDLGMQAAGAAHEMGTPLSTMLVVIGELKHETGALPEWQNSLNLLESQVRGCRQILDKMLAQASDKEQGQICDISKFMADTLDEWQLLRPTARYHYQSTGLELAPPLRVDATLRAALMNLLNNAADASPEQMEILARYDDSQFILQIDDHGSGISDASAARLGTAYFTTKANGRGLGLFLTNATLERLGGKVRLFNRDNGGTTTEVVLPMAATT